jgi:uncharacterized protein with HEPN domain
VRSDRQRLSDIVIAADAISAHLRRGGIDDGLVYDAVRVRLIEIGEAIKDTDADLLASEPAIRWTAVTRMRDRLAHRYFDTDHSIVAATVEEDLPPLVAAVKRLLEHPDLAE